MTALYTELADRIEQAKNYQFCAEWLADLSAELTEAQHKGGE
jgi:hypothetical protein